MHRVRHVCPKLLQLGWWCNHATLMNCQHPILQSQVYYQTFINLTCLCPWTFLFLGHVNKHPLCLTHVALWLRKPRPWNECSLCHSCQATEFWESESWNFGIWLNGNLYEFWQKVCGPNYLVTPLYQTPIFKGICKGLLLIMDTKKDAWFKIETGLLMCSKYIDYFI